MTFRLLPKQLLQTVIGITAFVLKVAMLCRHREVSLCNCGLVRNMRAVVSSRNGMRIVKVLPEDISSRFDLIVFLTTASLASWVISCWLTCVMLCWNLMVVVRHLGRVVIAAAVPVDILGMLAKISVGKATNAFLFVIVPSTLLKNLVVSNNRNLVMLCFS